MKKHVPMLDGLRFLAAFCVAFAHYLDGPGGDTGIREFIRSFASFGMAIFFVLSGFVIHYNYHGITQIPGGTRRFLVARFARLYPLYFVLFSVDFFSALRAHRTSCALAGDTLSSFATVPYFLTFTQSWSYQVVCKNSLIFQYFGVTAVMWSISVEAFFYVVYIFACRWLSRLDQLRKQALVSLASYALGVATLALVAYYASGVNRMAGTLFGPVAMEQNGYWDSLMVWLSYFNPVVNLPAFFCGAVAANAYLMRKDKIRERIGKYRAESLVLASGSLVIAAHILFCTILAKRLEFFKHTTSVLYVPLVAVFIYLLARFPATLLGKLLGSSLLVKLGEASYSIYLLHPLVGQQMWRLSFINIHSVFFTLFVMLMVSRISYLVFEKPAQRWVRGLFGRHERVGSPTTLVWQSQASSAN
jgi:peptidoglycan/LPS O-acetylase OafA/YrhL